MAYRALYRTYRPTVFSEVIGQEHITTTLQNQIVSGHVAHAYLFCGTRGTGKTSTAKIFARAVNCTDSHGGEPCGKCDACRLALDASNPDITEIDAASNNGVDDIRALIEKAHYAPLQLQTRVFIIDEVHMLSTSAFNALLKTLEEPPAHILFILATTEPQKLPATIISRCQRYDFHRLSIRDIVGNLKSVLARAGASIDEEGLLLIARSADGGMRDALSLADQCLAFCGDTVSAKDVYDVLGSMEQGFLFDMSQALLQHDAKHALQMLDGIVRGGRDLTVFSQDLTAHMRALMLAKTCGRCEDLLDCTSDLMDRYLSQAKDASSAHLLHAMQTLLQVQSEMRYLSAPRTALESALIGICRVEDGHSLTALEARLDKLEKSGVTVKHAQAVEMPTPVVPAAPAAPIQKVEPIRAVEPSPTPIEKTAEPIGAAPISYTAATLWAAALEELKKQNILIHAMAMSGVAQRLTDDTLTVMFPENRATQYNSVCANVNLTKLQAIVINLRPNTKLSLIKGQLAPVSPELEAKARELFGDKLTIE